MNTPKAMTALIAELNEHGWDQEVRRGEDTAGHSYIAAEARKAGHPVVMVCWHTRPTGGKSYRLFTVLYGHRYMSLKALREQITKGTKP